MVAFRVLACLGLLAAPTAAQESWSPFHLEDGLTIAFEGVADVRERRVHLHYEMTNNSGVRLEFVVTSGDMSRYQVSLGEGEVQHIDVEAPLALARPTPSNGAFRVQTYLTVDREGEDAGILVPAEITSFTFRTQLPDDARLVTSSVPAQYLFGETVTDQKLRSLPAITVVYTTAGEHVTLEVQNGPPGALQVRLRNNGDEMAAGLVLSAIVEATGDAPVAVDAWELVADDGVMERWQVTLPAIEPGRYLELALPGGSAIEPGRLHDLVLHNRTGDLLARQ